MMKRYKHKQIATIILLVLIAAYFVERYIPDTYSAAPLSGHVIDKVTKQPIKDAYVVVVYGLHGGLEGGYIAPLYYEEMRTDEEGAFHFKGFTDVPIDHSRAPPKAFVADSSPEINVFADGYLPVTATDRSMAFTMDGEYLTTPLDGLTVEMEPLGEDIQDNADISGIYFGSLASIISMGYRDGHNLRVNCALNKIPETKEYLMRMDEYYGTNDSYIRRIYPSYYSNCTTQGK